MAASSRRFSPATLFFLALSIVLGVLLYRERASREPPPEKASTRPRSATPRAKRRTPAPRPPAPGAADRRAPARIAIVVDDLGNDDEAVRRLARLAQPVAGAVLPGLPGSAPAARALARAGKEVILHLPMEPHGYPRVRPGPGVVVRAQSEGEIAEIFSRDLASVPGAVGVNNHMGSAATADPRVMRIVLRAVAGRGLFFLDSRTTDATVAADLARELGVPSASRQVFLDRVATEPAVRAALEDLLQRARRDGAAVGVGHPYPATLEVLEEELPKLASRGIEVVKLGDLMR
ncbi:MAG: divergent polysaccharide deacetylase family protein [Thermoanaerobaculia bacterium]